MRINPIEYKEVPKSELYNEIEEGLDRTNLYDKYGYHALQSTRDGGDRKIRFNPIQILLPGYLNIKDIRQPEVKKDIQDSENLAIGEITTSYNVYYETYNLMEIRDEILHKDNKVGLFKLRSKDAVVGIISVDVLTKNARGYVYLIHPSDTFDFKSPKTAALITDTIDYYKAIQSSIIPKELTQVLSPNNIFHRFYEKL